MHKATITYSDKSIRLVGDGHAGYAESGEDIVCSAISAVSYSLALQMDKAYRRGMLLHKPSYLLSEGHVEVEVFPNNESYAVIAENFRFAQSALELLEDSYDDCVSLTVCNAMRSHK